MVALRSRHDRAIASLAIPSLGALLAEPLFVATDTALVGHLGATALGGLGVAGTILQTAVGLLIFLAYATTPAVARRIGAGDRRGAARAGVDGLWLALVIGLVLAVGGTLLGPTLIGLFGAAPAVEDAAVAYLTIAVWGLPGMLVVVAATGFLRGLRDARTPLVVAVAGFAVNAALNAVLIYGLGWGVCGSAAGTVVAQTAMAVVLVAACAGHARRADASVRPGLSGVVGAARAGGWLLLRTLTLRIAMVGTVVAATAHGTVALGATQIVFSLFAIVWLALDALAIAGQAMIGHALGAADVPEAREVLRRLLELAVAAGAVLGVVVATLAPVLGHVFTADPAVLAAVPGAVLVMALSLPLGAVVFALDGILIGAGDGRYLALAGVLNLVVALPLLVLVAVSPLPAAAAVAAVQAVFGVAYMAMRALTLGLRIRTGRWARAGAA
ncbi:MATE family efflux transporter [Amnibacterium kyonggiense]|uniref:Putative MATE family efflux protein n=1 Tax=Amnibacterium kyonggiense TaxID=595671 RepID=A0A4R7FJ54_9MICO|nr:MATE family efflux transporter [Amnibacterium kyonggiense]TDS76012.1 putative MATE family efflux protein [Amnibacterium kyonggiense]